GSWGCFLSGWGVSWGVGGVPFLSPCPLWPLATSLLTISVDHGFELLGVALDGEDNGALLDAVGGLGDGGDDLPAVGQAEAHGKGAVGAQLDRLALERDAGAGFGGAVDDQLGVELEPELAPPAEAEAAGAEARHGRRAERAAQ